MGTFTQYNVKQNSCMVLWVNNSTKQNFQFYGKTEFCILLRMACQLRSSMNFRWRGNLGMQKVKRGWKKMTCAQPWAGRVEQDLNHIIWSHLMVASRNRLKHTVCIMLYNVHMVQKLCKMVHLLLIMLCVYLTHPNINMAKKKKKSNTVAVVVVVMVYWVQFLQWLVLRNSYHHAVTCFTMW